MFGEILGLGLGEFEESLNILEGELTAAGDSTASFAGLGTHLSELVAAGNSSTSFVGSSSASAEFAIAGEATTGFVGRRRRVARCEDAFEFLPLAAPAWAGTLRRAPMIQVRDMINDSPNSSTFTDTEEPQLGADVQMDVEGTGRLMGGAVQSYEVRGDGDARDSWAYDTMIADYLWLLNERRPFICFEKIAADVALTQMFDQFAPPDFTLVVEAGLPLVTVQFFGDLTFTECVSVICSRVNAHFKCDFDKVLQVRRTEGITENPADVDDDNDDLLWDPPPVLKVDASQIRNRVFVKGDGAKLLADAQPGATTLEVDGIDVYNTEGGMAIVGCQRINYEGVLKTFIYPSPDASSQVPGVPDAIDHLARFGQAVIGPIKTIVRYSMSMVIDGKESPRSNTRVIQPYRMGEGFSYGPNTGLTEFDNDGFVPAGSRQWLFGYRAVDGSTLYSVSTIQGEARFVPGRYTFPFTSFFSANDFRPEEAVLWRRAIINGNDDYYEADSTPISTGLSSGELVDGKADASLGNPAPSTSGTNLFGLYDTVGSRVYLVGSSLSLASAYTLGASAVKVYREEAFNGGTQYTDPAVCMTIVPTPAPDAYYEDTKQTNAFLWDQGESHNAPVTPTPPPPPPKIRLILFGVTGLTEVVHEGDEVQIMAERNDLAAQVYWAGKRGGTGIREFTIHDRNLRSDAELIVRGDAELTLFAMPILTVTYGTRDDRSVTGTFVNFNLTAPPIVASLRIQESTVDQIHEADNLVQRYSCVASSVKFTLEDLLRRALIREL